MPQKIFARVALLGVIAGFLIPASPLAAANPDEPFITIVGGGWGHGVGMSQYGALGRAEAGHTVEEILNFYYDGSTVEDRETELGTLLGDGIRVRLSPRYQDLTNRPDGVTATTRDDAHLLTVEIGDQTFTDVGRSVYLEQAGQIAGPNDEETQEADEWYWILKVDGGVDICVGCIASSATIRTPEGAIIDIVDDVGSQGAHDAGDLTLVGRDTALSTNPDTVFVVLQLPIEDYLHGIDEVPSSWPDAALQAQAIAARSYAAAQATTRRASGWSFDVYDSDADQVYDGYEDEYGNLIEHPARLQAAADTAFDVVVYDNEIVRTLYSSSNGGHTAASEDSFVAQEPFHIAKPDPFDAARDQNGDPQNSRWQWTRVYTLETLSTWLENHNTTDGAGQIDRIIISGVPPSGRVNDASVIVYGSATTLGDDESLHGISLYTAINKGAAVCDTGQTVDCGDLYSTNFQIITFYDVPIDAYYFDPVTWMTLNELTTGVSPNEFAPGREIKRAEVATFLHRFADKPLAELPGPFEDVDSGTYFEEAVAWMAATGITTGTTDTMFSPNVIVTRGQAAAFLWRFAGSPEPTVDNIFDDVEDDTYYTNAVRWMVEWEITTGTPAGSVTFAPGDPLTRAHIATFLWRLAGKPDAFHPETTLPSSMRT